jgi:hypothetical protein
MRWNKVVAAKLFKIGVAAAADPTYNYTKLFAVSNNSKSEVLLSVRGLVYLLAIVALLTILILGAGASQIIF